MLQDAMNKQYVDYDYYSKVYGGTAVPVAKFPRYARQAQALVDQITFGRIQQMPQVPEEAMDAVCAAAEVAYEAGKRSSDIKSENIDGYSATYGDRTAASLNAEMRGAAAPYLANTGLMFRGRSRKNDNKRRHHHL